MKFYKDKLFYLTVLFFIFVVVLWYLGTTVLISRLFNYRKGPPGDISTSVGALFSGLAFAVIAVTLWFQQRSFRQQREDFQGQIDALKDQNKILSRQAHEDSKNFRQQNDILLQQTNESSILELLSLHGRALDNFEYRPSIHRAFRGQEAVRKTVEDCQSIERLYREQHREDDLAKAISGIFTSDGIMGARNYFNMTEQLLRYVEFSVSRSDHDSLYGFICAQLSDDDWKILEFYRFAGRTSETLGKLMVSIKPLCIEED